MSHPGTVWEPLIARFLAAQGRARPTRIERLVRGQTNHVFRLVAAGGPGEVLRVRPPEKTAGSLRVEAAVLRRLRGSAPVPEVRLSDFTRERLPGDALLLEWLEGAPFPQAWARADSGERRRLAAQLATALEAVHAVRFAAPGAIAPSEDRLRVETSPEGWRERWCGRLERRYARLGDAPDGDAVISAARALASRCLPALEERPAALLHSDFHPGNWLAGGDGAVSLLDFELAQAGPLDLELDVLLRFAWDPAPFLRGASKAERSPATWRELPALLREVYPAPWQGEGRRARLTIYGLDYELSALAAARAGRWGRGAVRRVERRLRAVLAGDYPGALLPG